MNQLATIDDRDTEVVAPAPAMSLTEPTSLGISRVEIDMQMSTARAFPRSITRATKNIRDLVTLDKDAAAECMYALPRGGKPIQGPSIRLAEVIFQCWGNARCEARVVDVDRQEKVVVAEGIYHDLETNSASRATVRRSIVDRQGRIFKDDMITVTGNAACSIAKRNAILAGVPKAVWNRAYEAAREVVAGSIKTLAVSRDQAIAAFANFGVKPEQIFPAIGVGGLEEITLDHIPVLRGMFSAIKNGEATVEEMFNPRKATSTHEKVANPLADTPDHDADTGEIKTEDRPASAGIEASPDKSKVASPEAANAASSEGQLDAAGADKGQPTSAADDSKRQALLADLQPIAEKGSKALRRRMGSLSDEALAVLTDQDHDALGEAAEKADRAKDGAP